MSAPLRQAVGEPPVVRVEPYDVDRTARQVVKSSLNEGGQLSIWQGRVETVSATNIANQTADITLGGLPTVIPGVAHNSNYRPQVGDIIWVFQLGESDYLILDRVGAFGPSLVATAASAKVSTSQTRSSTSYGDLATVGPSVSVTVSPSGRLLAQVSGWVESNVAADGGAMGIALSGANTAAADDTEAQVTYIGTANSLVAASKVTLITGLNPGVTTVTAKYRSLFGGAAEFQLRHLWALPL